ncbi:amidase family protein [Streptomyces sp. SAI-229]|uniref:amidase family protein n=1 Tax=Streptomyces sp. SAI-229 TaxID=3377731 RepID=UPI003C7E68D6
MRDGLHRGPLHGIPYSLKDLIDVSGIPTTIGSRVRADRTPGEDGLRAGAADLAGR